MVIDPTTSGPLATTRDARSRWPQHGCPDLAAHKKEHVGLTDQVLEVQKKYKAGSTSTLSLEVLNFLKNWLIKHIQGTDKKYGPYLNGKGVH